MQPMSHLTGAAWNDPHTVNLANPYATLAGPQDENNPNMEALSKLLGKTGSGLMGTGQSMIAANTPVLSDERMKERVGDKKAAQSLLDAAGSHLFRYKGDETGDTYLGPHAQELAKTPMGKTLVKPGADGLLRVDADRVAMATASAAGLLSDQVDDLESRLMRLEGRGKKKKAA